jgi:hypothetical protein
MKIKAKIVCDNHEKVFFIPCGTGDKSFKWLGIVASQRYSTATPNGSLRRREDFCAMSEKSQYQTLSMVLPSGESPHPAEMINEYLREGDVVVITLCDRLVIDHKSGFPNQSSWVSLAYATSTGNLSASRILGDDQSIDTSDVLSMDEHSLTEEVLLADKEASMLVKSNAEFMRIVLESQMINSKKVRSEVHVAWSKVAPLIPKLVQADIPPLEDVFAEHWTDFVDLFAQYLPEEGDGRYLTIDDFSNLIEDAEVCRVDKVPDHMLKASQAQATSLSRTIFTRTCKYMDISPECFNRDCLMVALVLCAQAMYNDTLVNSQETGSHGKRSASALTEIFIKNFHPLATRAQLPCVLRMYFESDECLSRLRGVYHPLQAIFDKIAAKYRDIPTTIPRTDLATILRSAGLLNVHSMNEDTRLEIELAKITQWHEDVREGPIFGRDVESSQGGFGGDDDEPLLDDELTFPEFIEVIARAGHAAHFKVKPILDSERYQEALINSSVESPSIIGCFLKAFADVADGANHNVVKINPVTAKQTKGGGRK